MERKMIKVQFTANVEVKEGTDQRVGQQLRTLVQGIESEVADWGTYLDFKHIHVREVLEGDPMTQVSFIIE